MADISEAVRASFERCEETGDFAETFYGIFLASSPEIPPLFEKTDFEKQRRLLRATVQIMVTLHPGDEDTRQALERIGRTHGRAGLGIRPALYTLWLASLCDTVQKLDPAYTPALDQMWRARMAPGIELITGMY